MSLKDRGNEAFKSKKYKQAIKLYDEYLTQQHPDNKNAFFNMGLCYSKLQEHHKSIEACKSAIAIDHTYAKVYYRLMKEYETLKNPYEIFINARLYLKNQSDQSMKEVDQAKGLTRLYKDYFINKVAKQQAPKKLDDKDQILELIQPLRPKPEAHEKYNEQIDKYPNEWIEEWAGDVQSEEAKWLEIQYIIKELDYNTGISLAYFYLNQITIPKKRKEVIEKIKAIKIELNVEKNEVDEEYVENSAQIQEPNSSSDQALHSTQEQIKTPAIQPPKNAENKEVQQKSQVKAQKSQQSSQKMTEKETKLQKTNKIQQLLQKKSQNKKVYEESQETSNQTIPEKPKKHKEQNNRNPTPKVERKTQAIEIKEQKIPNSISTKPQQKSEEQIQALYKLYCGNLEKTKDIFVEVYKSIYEILRGKEASSTMGRLLILIKKRVKKFKLIVASFSDNEQKAILDLLSKQGMEEYAVDFAPKYHKV